MDSWLAWLAWALIGGNAEWLIMWKEAQGPVKLRQSKGLSLIQIDRRQQRCWRLLKVSWGEIKVLAEADPGESLVLSMQIIPCRK
jgi:hypothetical protein